MLKLDTSGAQTVEYGLYLLLKQVIRIPLNEPRLPGVCIYISTSPFQPHISDEDLITLAKLIILKLEK